MRAKHPGEGVDTDHHPAGDSLLVSVTDDGVGITEEQMGDLFDKFAQLKNMNESGDHKGTGLGLAICREIVNRHRGRIWAESMIGRGSGFHFIIPRRNGSVS